MQQRCPHQDEEEPQPPVMIYHTLNVAAEMLKIKKNAIYYYLKRLGIKTRHNEGIFDNRYAFISEEDIERIRQFRSPIRVVPLDCFTEKE